MSSFQAHHNFARISARKARYVADLVRGRDVNAALDILTFTHRRGSAFLTRLLKSAISNATQDGQVNANRLFVSKLWIDGGPLIQGGFRYNPGPMGRALPIRKRTSHIHIVLAERAEDGTKRSAAKTKAVASGEPANAGAKKAAATKTPAAKSAGAKKTTKAKASK
ncbi:MAG: 50S ribosomal protein L22 [Planctomycetota bacterium]